MSDVTNPLDFRKRINKATGVDKTEKSLEKPLRKGATAQRREATRLNLLQRQREELRRAEAEDEVNRRKSMAQMGGGRRSLIRSGTPGQATNLGGTA